MVRPMNPSATQPSASPALRVAGYVRVSTEGQAKEETHEVQIRWLREQAERHGWDLQLFLEPGVSGETIAARPQMQRMLAEVEAGRFDAVAAKAVDRLCRSQSLADWARIADTCKRAGVQIIGGGQTIDLQDATQALVFTLLGPGIAGFEKSMILSRTRDGMARALREGRKPHGVDPLGLRYHAAEKRWEIVESEARIIRRIYDMTDRGHTAVEVADALRADGVTGRAGLPMRKNQVSRILRSRTYRGEWVFKRGVVPVPAIVDADQWDRVQGKIDAIKRSRSGRKGAVASSVRGLCWCAACQVPAYSSNTGLAATPYLVCASGNQEYRHRLERCGNAWRRDRVASLVWDLAVQVLEEPALFARVQAKRGRKKDRTAELREDVERLELRLKSISTKQSGITLRWSNGLLDDDAYDRALETLASDRRAVEARLADARLELQAATERRAADPAAVTAIEAYRARLVATTEEERQRILRALCPTRGVHGVWLQPDGRIELRGIVPVHESSTTNHPRQRAEHFRALPFVASAQLPPKRKWTRKPR